MKKQSARRKKRTAQKKDVSASKSGAIADSHNRAVKAGKGTGRQALQVLSRRESEKRGEQKKSVVSYVQVSLQFLREAKMELKKVKWPTRKELLASTAAVILLVLAVAFFLGVIDFGLIKIIKYIVG